MRLLMSDYGALDSGVLRRLTRFKSSRSELISDPLTVPIRKYSGISAKQFDISLNHAERTLKFTNYKDDQIDGL